MTRKEGETGMENASLREQFGKSPAVREPSAARGCMLRLGALCSASSCDETVNEGDLGVGSRKVKQVSCEDCFFHRNLLCALALDEACPTFRPDHPDGLRPPQQMRFVFRQERRRQAAWAFPDAQEQAALHA
jgi:hypothetical protein